MTLELTPSTPGVLSSAGGMVERVTSEDESVTITNPTGPTVDLSVSGGSQPGALYQVIRDVAYTDFIADGGLGQGLSTVFYTLAADEVLLAGGIRVTEEFDDSAVPTFGVADETNSVNVIFPAGINPALGPGLPTALGGLVPLFTAEPGASNFWGDAQAAKMPESAPVGLIMFNSSGGGWVGDGSKGIVRVFLWIAKGTAS